MVGINAVLSERLPEQLRQDPLLMLLAGSTDAAIPLAGKSTMNRLQLVGEAGQEDHYKKVQ